MKIRTLPFMCIVLSTVGCSTMKQSDTSRTGLEQLLISNAVDQSLAKVDFRPISEAKVVIKSDLLDCVDKNYIILATKSKLLANKCTIVDKSEDADVQVEIASGGVGTDRTELVVGTPEIPLGLMGSIPKVNFYERNKAMGTAKLVVVATDVKSKQPVINSGYALARSDHQHWSMLGAGPVLSGSVATDLRVNTGSADEFVMPSISPMARTASR
ncbi:MAG: hypothetical protein LW870_13570 [Pirellula sp.]|nr:hypothetical protein [Pirellula sp.]